MSNEEKYQKWLEVAQGDLDTAEFMYKQGRYSYVAFMCQQAIEKLAKGLFVLNLGREAPYTHNVNKVLNDIDKIINSEKYSNYGVLFDRLTSYYIVGRYDVYKERISKNLEKDVATKLLNETKEAFLWLKSQQK